MLLCCEKPDLGTETVLPLSRSKSPFGVFLAAKPTCRWKRHDVVPSENLPAEGALEKRIIWKLLFRDWKIPPQEAPLNFNYCN